MKQIIFCIAAVITYAVVSSDGGRAMAAPAEEQTWTGQISDSMCGAKHKPSAEHGAGKQMTDRECTLACVKDHGAKYVFVSGGKVYTVGNQDMAALQEHAGHTVRLTGVMTGGDTISVSKIVMPAGKAK